MFDVNIRLFNGTFALDESEMEQKRPVQTMRTRSNRLMWSLIRPLSALFTQGIPEREVNIDKSQNEYTFD